MGFKDPSEPSLKKVEEFLTGFTKTVPSLASGANIVDNTG
jgi:hypothetical protein